MSTSNTAPSITILGVRVNALERIPRAGTIVGGLSRSSAYRLAEADGWPMVGPDSSRWVLMLPLLQRYGIPYTIEASATVDTAVAVDQQPTSDCGGCS